MQDVYQNPMLAPLIIFPRELWTSIRNILDRCLFTTSKYQRRASLSPECPIS